VDTTMLGEVRVHADDPLLGSLIDGRYRLVTPVGQGGMGVVYHAEDTKLEGRPCAVKLLLGSSMDPEEAERFEREVRIIARLRSPHVVQVLDTGRLEDGRRYIVMELLEGLPLSTLLKRGGPMEPARAVHIARGVLAGLAEAHEYGVVHRDLKPANVFITRTRTGDELCKVLDFGIAKETRGRPGEDLTGASMVVGTPKYMAPEQFLKKPADARTDLYAVGLLLYQMLSGAPPFHAQSPVPPSVANMGPDFRVGWLHVNQEPVPLPVSHELWTALDFLLAKDPQDRYSDAQAVIDALNPAGVSAPPPSHFNQDADPTGPSGVSSTTGFPIAGELSLQARQPRAPRTWMWALAATVVVGAGGLAAYLATQTSTPSAPPPTPARAAGMGECRVVLSTDPAGAVVTMGADVKGATPVTLRRPCREKWRVKLEKPGFRDHYQILAGRTPNETLMIPLKPKAVRAAPRPAPVAPAPEPKVDKAPPKPKPKARRPRTRPAPTRATPRPRTRPKPKPKPGGASPLPF
jgi:eukaryotic-like serine/threonine-protein kinase